MVTRFGVVGTAHWARTVHVPGLIATPEVELVGITGRNPDKVRAIAAEHGIRAFSDLEAMLDCVDAVSLAVPPEAQPALACMAAARGKHLLLEKPIALTLAGAQSILHATAGKVAGIVFFMRRFVPEIEQAIEQAAASRWQHARVRVHSSALSTATPYADSAWRQADGAVLWDIAPHILSVLVPVLGPVARVSARREAGCIVALTTTHAHGAVAESSMTLHAPADGKISAFTFEADGRSLTLPEPVIDQKAAYVRAAAELLALIAAGTTRHRCDVGFGMAVFQVLDAAERSIATGATVVPHAFGALR